METNVFRRSGFTLIEILIVIAVIAALSVVVILVLNPGELIRMARDSRRLSDLDSLNRSLHYYDVDVKNANFGSSSVIYVSIPDTDPGCANLGLPVVAGWSYACRPASTYRNNDGTGWIPVDFKSISFEPVVTTLPVDPVNATSGSLYYTYFGGSWELNATLESNKYKSSLTTDGGDDASLYEYGTKLLLAPLRTAVSTGTISISSISPAVGVNTTTISITNILGQNFQSGATVKLKKSGQSDIAGSGFSFSNSSTLTGGSFNLSSVATGTWDVVVTNPDTSSSTLTNGFTVQTSYVTSYQLPTTSTVTLPGRWTAPSTGWFTDEAPPTLASHLAQASTSNTQSPSITFYYNLGGVVPPSSTIYGICINYNSLSVDPDSSGTLTWDTDLTWNGGSSYTSANTLMPDVNSTALTGLARFNKDVSTAATGTDPGGASCTTWGRSWSYSEISYPNFGVRLTSRNDIATDKTNRFDVVFVKVWYGL